MKKYIFHPCLAIGLAVLLAGCAVYPAVQVAGGAMTGYDAVTLADEYLPRQSVKGGEIGGNTDKMLERRLRERLRMNQIQTVSAHVIERQAYLVGQVPDRGRADRAVQIASSVQGLKVINCKFYPLGSPRMAQDDTKLLATLARRLGDSKRLDNADLRVEVIQGNAILIGSAGDWNQKTAALAIASEVGGIREVVDYIAVRQQPETDPAGEEVVAN